jgi:hypothetical protein
MNSTMTLLRDIYTGKTNIVFKFMQLKNWFAPSHQWVACPSAGEMVIAFSKGETLADRNPVHYFKLFELLKEEPP